MCSAGVGVALLHLVIRASRFEAPPSLGPRHHLQGQSHGHVWVQQEGSWKSAERMRVCCFQGAGHVLCTHFPLARLSHVTSPIYGKGWEMKLLPRGPCAPPFLHPQISARATREGVHESPWQFVLWGTNADHLKMCSLRFLRHGPEIL